MIGKKPVVLITAGLIAAGVLAAATTGVGSVTTLSAGAAAPPTVDPVIAWNQTLLGILRTPGAQPPTAQPTRSLAMMHLAIYDAVNAIEHTGTSYVPGQVAPRRAAAAAADEAAHDTLVKLYPAQLADLDSRLASALAELPNGQAKRDGVAVGHTAAQAILARRAGDGSEVTPPPVAPGTRPGRYRPTPPNFAPAAFTHWSQVTPFALKGADQVRPGRPPRLSSRRYAAALREVQRLGKVDSTVRTADQTQVAQFWAASIPNYWNEIAQTLAQDQHTSLSQNARLFALLNVSLADATIGLYDAKYAYYQWRPVTAIRLANTDHNRRTKADPNWLPLAGNTAPDPSYPGAHSTISAAAAVVLDAVFDTDRISFSVRSEALPGVERNFSSISAAATEAGLSRIYAGQHTRIDHRVGVRLGKRVARYVVAHDLELR